MLKNALIVWLVFILSIVWAVGYSRRPVDVVAVPAPPAAQVTDMEESLHGARYINKLIKVGFRLHDPEGHEVLHFDDE